MKPIYQFFQMILLLLMLSCEFPASENQANNKPPEWAKDAIWYQIFVERFNNGDPSNDPKPENIRTASDFFPVPNDWGLTPWTQNWYQQDSWAKNLSEDFYANLQLRRYGGDLKGVMDKLDYLTDLGINAVYFNPLNDAPSLHKYDVRNFHHIDVNFGPDPEGDIKIMASENPNDPATWKWTSADKLFLELVAALHERNIRVILDYSWNHTGVEFWAWKDIVENGQHSAYSDWYDIIAFDNPETPENEFDYKGWINIKSLPEFKKVNTSEAHRSGFPFEGDLHPEVKKHVFEVTKRWLAPNGDPKAGIDGFRLDVADHIPMGFWRDYRQFVKGINPEAYLVGEIWWQDWPDKLMNPAPYLQGDVFDAGMFYQLYRPARYFFAETDFEIDAAQLVDSLTYQLNRLSLETQQVMMSTASTHDTPRLLTSFSNRGKYKFNAKLNDDPYYHTGKPKAETMLRAKLYLLHQFTNVGAPHIWNGEEMGMWGADDPDCRKPLWWPEKEFMHENRQALSPLDTASDFVGFNTELFNYYRSLIRIRKENRVLSHGELEFLLAEGKRLVYRRHQQQDEIFVIFNLEKELFTYKLPADAQFIELLDGSQQQGTLSVLPMTGRILKRL